MANHRLCILLLFLALICPKAAFGEEKTIFVASRSFDVAVAPVDEESKDAEEAILYSRRAPGEAWESLGVCRRIVLPNGDVRFTREVDVEHDGFFHYTSCPSVGGEVANPPHPDDPAQAVVVVDTLPPTAEILLPAEDDTQVRPGEKVRLSWTVADENLDEKPAAFSYTTDGGKSWNAIRRNLAPEGVMDWTAPADMGGPAVVRLVAVDKAGNMGRALRQMDPAPAEVARLPETAPAAPVTETVEQTPGKLAGTSEKIRDPNRSWLYYLMAVNLMRQNKPADALQYYWLAVKEDPEFINARADIALAYIDLGAFQTAREVVQQTRELAPDRIDLFHLMGETHHAEGMTRLGEARTTEERMEAKGHIDQAVAWYGRALDAAAKEWRLAEQAASFYRLGEICYYVNMDRDGARAYWKKILALHSPTPNSDLLKWSSKKDKTQERRLYERHTYQRVSLETWQNWARGYLVQMDARERKGILDLMPAQRVATYGAGDNRPAPALSYAGNAMNPGREDGRSLFSLPSQLGSPDDIAACAGVSGGAPGYNAYSQAGDGQPNFPAHMNRPPVTEGYSFYAGETWGQRRQEERQTRPARRRGRSAFSAREEPAPPMPDPYAFPQGQRRQPGWNDAQPYGNRMSNDW